jgi:hypothetical protein
MIKLFRFRPSPTDQIWAVVDTLDVSALRYPGARGLADGLPSVLGRLRHVSGNWTWNGLPSTTFDGSPTRIHEVGGEVHMVIARIRRHGAIRPRVIGAPVRGEVLRTTPRTSTQAFSGSVTFAKA